MKVLASLAIVLALTIAPADAGVATTILDESSSPIQFEGCYTTPGSGFLRWHVNGGWYYGGLAVRFRNRTTRPVRAIVFRFVGFDRFGSYENTVFHVITGTFSPNAEIDYAGADEGLWLSGMWPINGFDSNTTAIRCAVETVLFWDGGLWRRNDLGLKCHADPRTGFGYCTTTDLIPTGGLP